MGRHDSTGGRNFGWGKQLTYAGKNALTTAHGGGHFATVAAHAARWGQFSLWCKDHGVRDARNIDQPLVDKYASELRGKVSGGEIKAAYAQNLLSSVNVTLATIREDNAIGVAPSIVGPRSCVRVDAPGGIDRAAVGRVADSLRASGHDRTAAIVELARDLGLREKEAAMMNARDALRQALETGTVNVSEGTKGGRGREVDRLVPVSQDAMRSLENAARAQGNGRNLIPGNQSWSQFANHIKALALPVLRLEELGTVHDLRAAYACERYEQETGHEAPVISGKRTADRETDRNAREKISLELGHNRIEVVAEYVGSQK